MSRNAKLDAAVIRRQRVIAAGARESIEFASGYPMKPRPNFLAPFAGYVLAFIAGAGLLAFLARMAQHH